MGRTNIVVDDKLLRAGMKMTGCRSMRELVDLALRELVARKDRKKILALEGKLAWDGDLGALRKSRV